MFEGESADHSFEDTASITIRRTGERADAQVAAFSGRRRDWQRTAEKHLCRLLRLKAGWDGHQGLPVSPAIVDYGYRLLENIMQMPGLPLPGLTPLSYGGLILEWHRKGWDLEVEISAPFRHHVYTHELSSGEEHDLDLGANLETLTPLLRKVAD